MIRMLRSLLPRKPAKILYLLKPFVTQSWTLNPLPGFQEQAVLGYWHVAA